MGVVKVMVAVVVDLGVMVGLLRCKEIRVMIMEIRVIRLNMNWERVNVVLLVYLICLVLRKTRRFYHLNRVMILAKLEIVEERNVGTEVKVKIKAKAKAKVNQ